MPRLGISELRRKLKGFDRPVKYLIIGKPNLTKTSWIKKTGMTYFETDSLEQNDLFRINKYDLTKEVIIIGGKYYLYADEIWTFLMPYLKDYKVIMIHFKELN